MHGLLQRIEGQQPYGGLNPAFGLATARLLGQQLAENLQRQLPQSLALYGDPLLERRLVHIEAFDEVAAVQVRGLLQGVGGAFGKQALEGGYVDVHRGWIECNGPAPGHQDWRSGGRQCLVENVHGLPQALVCLLVAGLAPQQGCQVVARIGLARAQPQVRQQRLGFLGERDEASRPQPCFKTPQERKRYPCHAGARILCTRHGATS